MRTDIHPDLADLPAVREADAVLRKCVHCGFCTATCPTYRLLGDELDGPRGRIYLIKNLLEDNRISAASVTHLDRCLTCRACETTCPSGVAYGRLLDIGRELAAPRVRRPVRHRLLAALLRLAVPRRWLFRPALRLGQLLRPLLPPSPGYRIPARAPVRHKVRAHPEAGVILLSGCVQSAATPNVLASLLKILNRLGIAADVIDEGCCGALDYHLSAHKAGIARMKRVIDRLYPRLDRTEAIVSSASGCGLTIREYPRLLQYEPGYAARAEAVAAKVVDAVELLRDQPLPGADLNIAVHTPCTMQHGMGLTGAIEAVLAGAGFTVLPCKDGHLCCGSAGAYAIMQPDLSHRLGQRKLAALKAPAPDVIVTANVGCQLHLGRPGGTPVMHWLELVADGCGPDSGR